MNVSATLLIIDDEPDNYDVIEALLDQEGYYCHYSSSGVSAIASLDKIKPDIILLDLMMPQMSGLGVCRVIKSNAAWRHIPVIIVTALSSKEDLSQCFGVGADDFIAKPVNRLELKSRVKSMLRIKQQYDCVQRLLTAREDMVSMIVHDLRIPVSTTLLSADFLSGSPNLSPKEKSRVDMILTATRQLQSLIDDMLVMGKLNAGQMPITPTTVNMVAMCHSALEDIKAIALQRDILLHLSVPEEPILAQVDAAIMRRVIDNLLSNAIKFSPRHSEVRLQVSSDVSGLTVQVSDQGVGIQPELRDRIFEKYNTGDAVEGTSQLGLGLAFCKSAIAAHNGTITVKDNPPKGAVFTLHLPMKTAAIALAG